MKKQLLTAVIAVVSLCACSERPGPSMGWTAQNAVDKLCGRYEVESLTWDGPEADINGDGIIAPTHLEELLQGPWDGIQDPGGPFVYVIPASELGKGTNVDAHLFIGFIDWPVKYSLMTSFSPSVLASSMMVHTNGNVVCCIVKPFKASSIYLA